MIRSYDRRYLAIYALAAAGSTIAFQPLLGFLLPLKVIDVRGHPDATLLGWIVAAGGVAAGLSNMFWGQAGDRAVRRGGSRRRWIVAGLIATAASFALLALAQSVAMMVLAIVAFQTMLNLLLSALTAAVADEVPDRDKGLVGGIGSLSGLAGALAGVAIAASGLSIAASLACLAATIAALLLPFVLLGGYPILRQPAPPTVIAPPPRHELALLWSERFLLQLVSKTIFFFLIFYFGEVATTLSLVTIAQLGLAAAIGGAAAGLTLGRLSDRLQAHRPILIATIAAMATGLALMGLPLGPLATAAGYLLFGLASAAAVALHTGYALLRLPETMGSGKALGIINLANTLPTVIIAGFASTIIPSHGYRGLCLWLAGATLVSGGLILAHARRPPRSYLR